MSQLFANAARSPLMASILAGDTTLTVDAALADLYPVADTGTDPVPTVGKDFFKIVLENALHEKEIVYVRTRALGDPIFSNVIRGQEGTTARAYTAGDVVGLRHTAADLAGAIDLAANATTAGKSVLNAATITAYFLTLLVAVDAAAMQTLLGISTFVKTLLAATTATAFRALIGAQIPGVQDFRLTLTTAVPVTTADVTGATTIYDTPFTGKYIDLFDGTNWNRRASAEMSIALGTLTSGIGYDVFCYDNAGTPTLELTAWASSTARATALAMQDGVLCKSGALTRRYRGSFFTTSTTTTEDSKSKGYLFNYDHRKPRRLERNETTASWTNGAGTWGQGNGSTANQVNWFVGVVEDESRASLCVTAKGNSSFGNAIAIGLNSTTVPTGQYGTTANTSSSSIPTFQMTASHQGYPQLGLNYYAWLEWAESGSSETFYGVQNSGTLQVQSGITATVMA